MFRLAAATAADERLAELERFVEFWYGPRRPEYGDPAALTRPDLPAPLRRFYAFAGFWPSPGESADGESTFYSGHSGHHLHTPDSVESAEDSKLKFFMEYQGDWDGLTLAAGDDPPVWIRGTWEGDEEDKVAEQTRQVSDSLSKFLVTHCLMATAYEFENAGLSRTDAHSDGALVAWLWRNESALELLWEVEPGGCPNYEGAFYLAHGHVLVHKVRQHYQFAALHPEGAALLRAALGEG